MRTFLRRAGGLVLVVALCAAAPAAAHADHGPVCHGLDTAIAPGGERTFPLHCSIGHASGPLSATVVDQPDHGRLDVIEGTWVRYVPAAGYTGPDSFAFRVRSGTAETPVVTQALLVASANHAPRCRALDVTAVAGTVSIPLPCYDPDEGDAVRVRVVDEPEHGQVDPVALDAGISYHADAGYLGGDAFRLQATDGTLTSDPEEVTVDVAPLEAPVCESSSPMPVRTGHAKRYTPRCSDNRPSSFASAVTYEIAKQPSHGQVEPDGYGRFSFIYTPDPGFEGEDGFKLRPSNAAGAGSDLSVPVAVADDANEPPDCSGTGVRRVRSGATVPVPGSCSDPDGDPVTRTFSPEPAHGALGDDSSTPFGGRNYTADDGYTGPDHYGLRGDDGRVQTVAVHQLEVVDDDENTLPQCRAQAVRVRTGRSASIGLACHDLEHDPLTFTWTQPEHGTLEEGGAGVPFPATYLVYTPDADHVGDDRITFRAADGRGRTVPITVLIEVVDPPAPRCARAPRRSVRSGGTVYVTVGCYGDEGPVPTAVVSGPAHGTVTQHGADVYAYTPTAGFTGVDSFTVRATTDGGTAEVVQEIEVGDHVNALPTCTPHGNALTREAPVTLRVSCQDADGDALQLETIAGPAHGAVGPWDQSAREVVYTPDAGFTGDDEFTFRASDGRGHSTTVTQRVRVRAEDANDGPRCANTSVGDASEEVKLWPQCTDPDGDAITVAIAGGPEHGTATGPDASGAITYRPDPGFRGFDGLTVTATDADGVTSVPAQLSIQVGPPIVVSCSTLAANVRNGQPRRVRRRCRTWRGTPATPQVLDGPDHGTLGAVDADGWVRYTPAAGFAGADAFTYGAKDGDESSGPARVELRVTAAPPPPPPPPPLPEGGEPPAPPRADPPPVDRSPANQTPKGPPRPLADPLEQAAEQRLGGDAVPLDTLRLGPTRAFVPVDAADGTLTVDGPSESVVALVCPTACEVTAGQRITLSGRRARAAKVLRLRTQRLSLLPQRPGVVTLRLTKAQRRSLRRARRATLRLSVVVKDASGKTVRGTARLRLGS